MVRKKITFRFQWSNKIRKHTSRDVNKYSVSQMRISILSFVIRDKRNKTYGPHTKRLLKSRCDKINRNYGIMEKNTSSLKWKTSKSHRPKKTDTSYHNRTTWFFWHQCTVAVFPACSQVGQCADSGAHCSHRPLQPKPF